MKSVCGATMLACLMFVPCVCLAFQVSPPSSFVGRRVYSSRTGHGSSPPPILSMRSSSMPPIIQRILAKQAQQNSVDETNTVSVVDSPTTTTATTEATSTLDSTTALESTTTMTDATTNNENANNNNDDDTKEELTETENMMQQVKDAGLAGVISYALWEIAFWAVSVPVCVFGYREVTGHWPDFQNKEDMQTLGAEAFAFVNFARFAVPLRIGLALSTTPWMEENVVEVYFKKHDGKDNDDEDSVPKDATE